MSSLLPMYVPKVPRHPWAGVGKKIESMCRKALYKFELLKGVDKLAVALSGGKDSLSLLFMLHAISGRGFPPIQLYAIHVGGAFSCGAQVGKGYLRALCDELSVPLILCSAEEKEQVECYSCSRRRRGLIFEAAKKVGATTIAFGHHREDSIHTLLMNLFHKAECAAMLPRILMVDYGVTLIRPLIFVPEKDIKEFARSHGFARSVCQCPIGQRSMRKHTKDLLEQIEHFYPNVRTNLSQASFVYGSDKAINRCN